MAGGIKVSEKRRRVQFIDGTIANFDNVTWFDPSGTFLRMICDQGYVLINTANVLFYTIPDASEKVV